MGTLIPYALGILVLIMTGFSGVVFSSNTKPQTVYPRIAISDLRSQFKSGYTVKRHEISAEDLIQIIAESSLDIHIEDCQILGSLDFRGLQKIPVEKIQFPEEWSSDVQTLWIKQQHDQGRREVHRVSNSLEIVNTPIKARIDSIPKEEIPLAVNTGPVFFERPVFFSDVTFENNTSFAGAVFGDESEFSFTNFQKGDFSNTVFHGKTRWIGTVFKDTADFSKTIFNAEVNFVSVTIDKEALFAEAAFNGKTDFVKVFFNNKTDFSTALFKEAVKFNQIVFKGEANFTGADFYKTADFPGAKFTDAYFVEAHFSRDALFSDAAFEGNAGFKDAWFDQNVSFERVKIHKKTDFNSAEFIGDIYFRSAAFNGDVDFQGTKFFQTVSFLNSEFKKEVYASISEFGGKSFFTNARFHGNVHFTSADFGGEANFAGVRFMQRAYFNDATFMAPMHAEEARFDKLASFKEAKFRDELKLDRIIFSGYVDFRQAEIAALEFVSEITPCLIRARLDFRDASIDRACFKDIFFLEEVNFSNACFGIPGEKNPRQSKAPDPAAKNILEKKSPEKASTTFNSVTFDANAAFVGTTFCGITQFINVKFVKDAVFTNAVFQHDADQTGPALVMHLASFNNLVIQWDQLPELRPWKAQNQTTESAETLSAEPLSRITSNLMDQFKGRKQLKDSNSAYYHMKRSELKEARSRPIEGWGDALAKLWLEIEWFSWGVCFGYGTKLFNTLATFSFFCLVFAVIYFARGNFKPSPETKVTEESGFLFRGFVSPKLYFADRPTVKNADQTVEGARKFLWAVLLSLTILFKFKLFKGTISGKIGFIDLKHIIIMEWTLGYVFFIALILTLKKTSPLFSAIISLF